MPAASRSARIAAPLYPTTAIILTLVAYKVVLLGIGFLASRSTQDEEDFYLGGRKLGPLVSAVSASASSSSA